MIKNILKKLLPFIFSKYIKFVYKTNKWTRLNDGKVKELWSENKTFIWIHWHGQSLMLPNHWSHSSQKLNALVSRHGDGDLIAKTLDNLGIELIRGAGNPDKLGLKEKGGTVALRAMLKVLRNEQSVAFTADQPPGPGKIAGKGSIILAKLSGCPIIPVAATTSKRFEFDNWDNFTLNYPFGSGSIVFGDPIYVDKNSTDQDIENKRLILQESLNAITTKAKELL
ncbi:MAG: lysophospholipid acyltransferase family protein [Pseudomonadota bacterium]|nr:lysophospholipid acyltransferase family protein [Pseudomonadota bacterium]